MTSRERFLRALRFEDVDRVPFNFWADRRLLARYEERFGPYFRPRHYGADVWECLGLFAAVGPLFPAGHEAWAHDEGVTHRVPFFKALVYVALKVVGFSGHASPSVENSPACRLATS